MGNNMKEVWKSVIGYEGIYEVSNSGRVRSVDCFKTNSLGYVRFVKGREIFGAIDQDGYRKVLLYSNQGDWKKRKAFFVHSLVLTAFRGARPEKSISRHLDGNPSNNYLANLKWGTATQNCEDRDKHGRTYCHPKGDKHPQASLTKSQSEKIKKLKGKFTQEELAKKYGVSRITIHRIWSGKRYL